MELNGKGILVVVTMCYFPGLLAHDLSICRLTGGFRRMSVRGAVMGMFLPISYGCLSMYHFKLPTCTYLLTMYPVRSRPRY